MRPTYQELEQALATCQEAMAELGYELDAYRYARLCIEQHAEQWDRTRKWVSGEFKYSDEACTTYRMALAWCLGKLEVDGG